jgi:hypothetical protein
VHVPGFDVVGELDVEDGLELVLEAGLFDRGDRFDPRTSKPMG